MYIKWKSILLHGTINLNPSAITRYSYHMKIKKPSRTTTITITVALVWHHLQDPLLPIIPFAKLISSNGVDFFGWRLRRHVCVVRDASAENLLQCFLFCFPLLLTYTKKTQSESLMAVALLYSMAVTQSANWVLACFSPSNLCFNQIYQRKKYQNHSFGHQSCPSGLW